MTKTEALKLALDALKESQTDNDTMEFWERKTKAITTIKAALAKPSDSVEQEPVAFVKGRGWQNGNLEVISAKMNQTFEIDQPLYTTPPKREWVVLTDKEMHECAGEYPWTPTGLTCCRAIEAKLKEKNS